MLAVPASCHSRSASAATHASLQPITQLSRSLSFKASSPPTVTATSLKTDILDKPAGWKDLNGMENFRKWYMQTSTHPRLFPFKRQLRCSCSASNLDFQESKLVLRRSVVYLMSTLFVAVATSSAGAKPMMPMMVEPDLPKFWKTATGVRIQEVVDGSGPEAKTGDTLEFDFVCRRSNGYFVYSTVDQFNDQSRPAVLPIGTGKMIAGLEEVLVGMRPGGKRRALIPPEVGYTLSSLEPQPREFGPRRALMSHAKEPLVFEVQLLKIK